MIGSPNAAREPMSGTGAITAVATGACSVSDVVSASLAAVRELDGRIGAFRVIDEKSVERRARELDDRVIGPLQGLVVGVKDVIDTADLTTEYGSPLFSGNQPAADAEVVRKLTGAGAIVLGKTESTEFAMYQPTRTRNPVDLSRTPGGSSSGSAAAVAAGMVPVALGTQTAGSVIRPAAYCGVYGLKPSRGWASTAGIWQLSERLDTVGLFSRSVGDLVLSYRALRSSYPSPRGSEQARGGRARSQAAGPEQIPPRRQRHSRPVAAVLPAEDWGACDSDVNDALAYVGDCLRQARWDVREMAMPSSWRHLPEIQDTIMAVDVARNLHAALGPRVDQISDKARAIVEHGDGVTARGYLGCLNAADEALAVLLPLAATIDVLIAPSALGVAPEGLEFTGDPVMCRPWTLLGLPAANVPGYRRGDGLPVGVQAVAPHGDDVGFLDDLVLIETGLNEKE